MNSLFPVRVPELENPRRLPNALARTIGPMFGVVSEQNPYDRTWICDYESVTLSELGRGAPLPGKLGDLRGIPDADKRVAEIKIPGSTINSFGPDTKAAVVLVAANELFAPLAEDIVWALEQIRKANPDADPVTLLVGWAYATLAVYRSQPLLGLAAVRARTVQRALSRGWQLRRVEGQDVARCELGSPELDNYRVAPMDFLLVDATVRALEPAFGGSALRQRKVERAAQRIATTWCRVLLQLGSPAEGYLPAVVAAADPSPGHRVLEAYISPLSPINALIEQQAEIPLIDWDEIVTEDGEDEKAEDGQEGSTTLITTVPDIDFASVGENRRRLLIETLRGVARWQLDKAQDKHPLLREANELLGPLAEVADAHLGEDDPVRWAADLALCNSALRQGVHQGGKLPAKKVISIVSRVIKGNRAGSVDMGLVLEMFEQAGVLLSFLRRRADPENLDIETQTISDALEEMWSEYIDVFERRIGVPEGASAAGFYLHNYAGYLASPQSNYRDLQAAARYFSNCVLPSRRERYEQSGEFAPLRLALQVAARGRLALARLQTQRGDVAGAVSSARESLELMREVLTNPKTKDILERAGSRSFPVAMGGADVLIEAIALGISPDPEAGWDEAASLLSTAAQYLHSKKKASKKAWDEVAGLRARLIEVTENR